MVITCNKCRSLIEVAENCDWGYCPICENDQVEVVEL